MSWYLHTHKSNWISVQRDITPEMVEPPHKKLAEEGLIGLHEIAVYVAPRDGGPNTELAEAILKIVEEKMP